MLANVNPTFSRERMFGPDYDMTSSETLFTSVLIRDSVEGKKLPPEVPAVAKRSFPALEKVEAIRELSDILDLDLDRNRPCRRVPWPRWKRRVRQWRRRGRR